jgi:plasmid stabilization system protein ParE
VARLKKHVDRLRLFPESGSRLEDVGRDDLRDIVFQDYRIVYRFDGKTVKIMLVQHAAKPVDLPRTDE